MLEKMMNNYFNSEPVDKDMTFEKVMQQYQNLFQMNVNQQDAKKKFAPDLGFT